MMLHFVPLLSTLMQFESKHGLWHARVKGCSVLFSAPTLDEAIRGALLAAGIDPDDEEL